MTQTTATSGAMHRQLKTRATEGPANSAFMGSRRLFLKIAGEGMMGSRDEG